MTALIVLHPRTVEQLGLYKMCLRMRDRGYEIDATVSPRFFVATPAPPPVRPPPTVPAIERRARPHNLWWPRT